MKEVADKHGVTRQTIYNILKAERNKYGKTEADHDEVKLQPYADVAIDPVTGYGVSMSNPSNRGIIIRMGDEKVTQFVAYHMDMMAMRQGVNKRDVPGLYQRFYNYLSYCADHGIVPNNANCYFAIGVNRQEMSVWRLGKGGTPEHKEFADTVQAFFASIHEQGATDGVLNPISAMFWQKAYDNLIEASKLEVVQEDPLGDRKSAEEIAKSYGEVELPD